jgi:YfiH family protein
VSAEFLESSLLRSAGFRHAFFSRRGGVSKGPYESLNFSVTVGDDPRNVARNLELSAEVLGVSSERVYFLSQVHGAVTKAISGSEAPAALRTVEGDAVASRGLGLACSVRTADCVPILAGDRRTGAAVAIHAGWRGVVRGIVESGISELRVLAGEGADIALAIGPHIRERAFEVSEDVALELESASPVGGVVDRSGKKPHVSLLRIVRAKLIALGIPDESIDDVGGCTHDEPERFFSFRRDGKIGGRHLSAIVPRSAR